MTSKSDGDEELLQAELSKLEAQYAGNDNALRADLKAQGLGNMPFSAQTRKLLIKKLAQKRLQNSNSKHYSAFSSKVACQSGTLEEDSSSESNSSLYSDDPNKTFYALCIPGEDEQISIESDFLLVLKKMKEYSRRKPRMLSFSNYYEAVTFANKMSANDVCQTSLIKATFPKEKAELENNESVPFPSVTVPQLNAFRIHLERGNISLANEMISSNPRFLIGTGDVPTILKAGPRYNALHSCVFTSQLSSCKLIMKYVCDIDYLKKMYDTKERAERYSNRLVDLYLNTPEKMMNKTPLHFASEKGLVEIVAFLVSFNACDRHLQKTQIACDKYYNSDKETVKQKIVNLIRETTCFVPLVRSDTTGPYAKVVEPYSPSSHHRLVQEVEDNLKSSSADDLKDFSNLKVWAYAGPMSPQEAHKFKKEWWSPRVKKDLLQRSSLLNVTDGERGFEHYGRELAKSYNVSWQEYWPFLDSFANFNSLEGLRKLQYFFVKHSILLHFDQVINHRQFVKCEALTVDEDFVHEIITEKDDNESYISVDSLSELSSSSSSDNECNKEDGHDLKRDDNDKDDCGDEDECFYDCQEKEVDERDESRETTVATHTMSPFGRLWSGLVQLGYYLSPKRGAGGNNSSRQAEQNNSTSTPSSPLSSSSSIKNCDSNSNTVLSPSPASVIKNNATDQNCDKNYSTQSNSRSDMSKDFVQMVKRDDDIVQERKGDDFNKRSVVDKHDNSPNKRCVDNEIDVKCAAVDTDLFDCKDPKHFSTPVSYRKYRNSTPADLVSPDQQEVDSRHTTPDIGSPASLDNSKSGPGSSLDNSLDRKIDSFCHTLKAFSFKSPLDSSGERLESEGIDNECQSLPSMTLVTCNGDISLLEKGYEKCLKTQRIPVLLLKQAEVEDRKKVVLADLYIPATDIGSVLVLDDNTHKTALSHVWLNFLITFECWEDASRILSMDEPEMLAVKIRRITPTGKTNFTLARQFDAQTLVDEYRKKRQTVLEDKDNVGCFHLQALVVNRSSVPPKDVYICGSIPTKTDADVYKCLNDEAVRLIHSDKNLYAVCHWFERMDSSGQKSIECLPSPSRVLRLSRQGQAPPPVSPLVKYDTGRIVDSPLSRGSRSREENVVRNIFKSSLDGADDNE